MPKLISFDIDGTLETGDPPGSITIDRVRAAVALGYIVGSCSDRTVAHQQRMWSEHGIAVAFTVLKHHLERVRAEIAADAYIHIGDTHADEYYAGKAGFAYYFPDASIDHLWLPGEG
jgi:FMN phosphatase YigB (HAD superfamily)